MRPITEGGLQRVYCEWPVSLSVGIWQLSPGSFKTHLSSFPFIWAPVCVVFLSPALHCFCLKLLFIVCCTAFSIHIMLIHSWCDIARNRVGTVIGRWKWDDQQHVRSKYPRPPCLLVFSRKPWHWNVYFLINVVIRAQVSGVPYPPC